MPDDEKLYKNAKRERRRGEEIHGRDGIAVIPQNASQPWPRIFRSPHSSQPAGDGRFETRTLTRATHHESSALPRGILRRDASDQSPKLRPHRSSASNAAGSLQPFPVQPETLPMASTSDCYHPDHNLNGNREEHMSVDSRRQGRLAVRASNCWRRARFSSMRSGRSGKSSGSGR